MDEYTPEYKSTLYYALGVTRLEVSMTDHTNASVYSFLPDLSVLVWSKIFLSFLSRLEIDYTNPFRNRFIQRKFSSSDFTSVLEFF